MDSRTQKNTKPAVAGNEAVPAALESMLARARAGETVGIIVIETHPGGTADRWAAGDVFRDRYRLAGLALSLAHGALDD